MALERTDARSEPEVAAAGNDAAAARAAEDMPESPEPGVEDERGGGESGEPDGHEAPAADGHEEAERHQEAAALEDDLAQLHAKARERDEYLALAQRAQADFDNYRKRTSRDVAAAEARGVSKLARELLPALDNLALALAAAESGPAPERDRGLLEGVRLVQSELLAALARVGIEAYSPVGEPFDPELHEAMAQQPVEGAESGTIVEVYQPGYRYNGGLLRAARVVVAA
jgi:molecular chaperone GrpE